MQRGEQVPRELRLEPQVVARLLSIAVDSDPPPIAVLMSGQLLLGMRGGEMPRVQPWHFRRYPTGLLVRPFKHATNFTFLPITEEAWPLFGKWRDMLQSQPAKMARLLESTHMSLPGSAAS